MSEVADSIESKRRNASRADMSALDELMLGQSDRRRDALAFVAGSARVTRSQLREGVERLADAFVQVGVRSGVPAVFRVEDPGRFITTLLAIWRARGIAVPLPLHFGGGVVHRIVEGCAPCVLVSDDSAYAQRLVHDLPLSSAANFPDEPLAIFQVAARDSSQGFALSSDLRDVCSILYSSGTTNTPKGVRHTFGVRASIIKNHIANYGLTEDTVTVIGTPLYTPMTWEALLPTLAAGGCCVVQQPFSARAFARIVDEEHATFTFLVPTHYVALLSDPSFSPHQFDSLRLLLCAGAKLDSGLKRRLLDAFPHRFAEVYGASEGHAFTFYSPDAPPEKLHSVGRPLPGVALRILSDDRTTTLPPNTPGEIAVHSPNLMSGYHDKHEETQTALWSCPDDGLTYYRSGDLGFIDEQQFLTVLGRNADLIISGGFNIHPSDIEHVLLEHPDVLEAVAVGRPEPTLGETPVAFVVLRRHSRLSSRDLLMWTNARVSSHQHLFALTVVDALPHTPNGKVARREVRDSLCVNARSPVE